ncbi:MAG: peptidoglycan-binding protein [Oscillospiraceae bacterium]|jgi:g-D-glutamyl-meso-diaminopimelate peptidase|nr:peptidoglycan-binding protein [Oscillospiraceae bacterium]
MPRTLREGQRGALVEMLQWGLRQAVCCPQTDGIFGAGTLRALQAFQQTQALEADGIAGAQTWKALHPYLINCFVHTVQPGDTPRKLAAHYDSTPGAILVANQLKESVQLLAGANIKIPSNKAVVPTNIRWSSCLLDYVLQGLKARFPFLQITKIGSSVLGQPIWLVRIGKGKKRVGYNAAHHANEWLTTPVLLHFLEQYAAGVAHGGHLGGVEYTRLFENYTLDMVPMVNPDGVDLVTGALDTSSEAFLTAKEIAAGFPFIPFPDGWKANIRGIDLNLCYPADWKKAQRAKFAKGFVKPAPRDYVGTMPLDAPEAHAMYTHTLAEDYRLILAYHSQGKLIYWKYNGYDPAGSWALANRMQGLSGYAAETTPDYSGSAGYKDWFIARYNRSGYTIEVGAGQNPLPTSQFDQIYRDNIGILLLGMIGLEE